MRKKIRKKILPVLIGCVLVMLGVKGTITLGDWIGSSIRHICMFQESDEIDISEDMTDEIPRLYQWDKRWKKKAYGTSTMEISGCGPTCLSMVYCGLTKDTSWNPYAVAVMAEKEGYYVSGTGTSWKLMTKGASFLGLEACELPLVKSRIVDELNAGHPIICAMGPGDFTTTGHFIVLTRAEDNKNIVINDPNSQELSEKTWDIEVLMGQMKNLWAYQK